MYILVALKSLLFPAMFALISVTPLKEMQKAWVQTNLNR